MTRCASCQLEMPLVAATPTIVGATPRVSLFAIVVRAPRRRLQSSCDCGTMSARWLRQSRTPNPPTPRAFRHEAIFGIRCSAACFCRCDTRAGPPTGRSFGGRMGRGIRLPKTCRSLGRKRKMSLGRSRCRAWGGRRRRSRAIGFWLTTATEEAHSLRAVALIGRAASCCSMLRCFISTSPAACTR